MSAPAVVAVKRARDADPQPDTDAATAAAAAGAGPAAEEAPRRKKSRFSDAPPATAGAVPTAAAAAFTPSPSPSPSVAAVADDDGFVSRAAILAASKTPANEAADDDGFMMPPPRPRAPPTTGMAFGGAFAGRPPVRPAGAGAGASPFGALKKPLSVGKPMGFNFLAAAATKKPMANGLNGGATPTGAPGASTPAASAPAAAAAASPVAASAAAAVSPDAVAAPAAAAAAVASPTASADEVDPLEAFMSGLSKRMTTEERAAVSGEMEKAERESYKEADKAAAAAAAASPAPTPMDTSADSTDERKESEARNGVSAAASVGAAAAPASSSASPSAPAVAAGSAGVVRAERYYGDEEQVDESVISAHNSAAETGLSWLEKQAKVRRKDLKPVDHSKINYLPFRKDFYIESKEIAAMSDQEVAALREGALEGTKIRGKKCPKPVRSWLHCGLPDAIYNVIQRERYARPFPIQAQAIPAIMSGRDVIACAKTGSGKTLAFVLPMLRHVLDQPPAANGEGAIAVILAPTRELATQIYNECKKFCKVVNLRVVCVYGGASVAEQITLLKRGTDVIVATPGRMIDMLHANSGRLTNLTRTTFLVLDEADRMFDMGFEPQVLRILDNVRPDRQTVMFSATFPRNVETLAKRALRNPLEIIIGGRSVASASITQFVEVREAAQKFPRLLEILGHWYSLGQNILIFVDKQEAVDSLFRQLIDAGYPCLALHGGMDQSDRDFTVADFKSKLRTIMVATSIVARGLDVKDLSLVINYEVPNHYEDYVHRVGRTGRAGKPGTAITFVEPSQLKYAPDLVRGLVAAKQVVPADLQKMADEFEQMRKEGKVKYASNEGYSSAKGFKFDETEAAEVKERQRLRNLQDNPDADLDELQAVKDDAKSIEDKRAGKAAAAAAGAAAAAAGGAATAAAGGGAAAAAPQETKRGPSSSPPPVAAMDPIARQLAIAKQAAMAAARAMAAQSKQMLLGGGDSASAQLADQKVVSAMQAAREAEAQRQAREATAAAAAKAAAIAAQLSRGKAGGPGSASSGSAPGGIGVDGEEKRAFFSEIEINDYPQHARWKVTHKGALDSVIDLTDCAVTTKGGYIPPGRNAMPGERKLHLLVEGNSEVDVQRCKAEIIRMLEEAAADSRPDQPVKYAKYSIV